jgi:hypothetical protein
MGFSKHDVNRTITGATVIVAIAGGATALLSFRI